MKSPVFSFIKLIAQSKISFLGALIVTSIFLIYALLFFVDSSSLENPYVGILIYAVLPGGIAFGLSLIPLGLYIKFRPKGKKLPSWSDLREIARENNKVDYKKATWAFIMLTGLNLVFFTVVGYSSHHFMDSPTFCGQVCHTVMEPEYVSHRLSPHSGVICVDCHIGPGVGWFIKAKINGTKQVISVVTNTYPRPIPTPVHNLRPARDTCENCHRPEQFHGNLLKVQRNYLHDEENTLRYTILNLRVGGGGEDLGHGASGIHWHVSKAITLLYDTSDEQREHVTRVTLIDETTGKETTWRRKGEPEEVDSRAEHESSGHGSNLRAMDCVDCHNRTAHGFENPEKAIDELLGTGEISPNIPWIKREALKVLEGKYLSDAEVEMGIGGLAEMYQENMPEVWKSHQEQIETAIESLISTWQSNVFPDMLIDWGTYPDQLSHKGCMRCHNDDLINGEGQSVNSGCELCHFVLAEKDEDPEVFRCLHIERTQGMRVFLWK